MVLAFEVVRGLPHVAELGVNFESGTIDVTWTLDLEKCWSIISNAVQLSTQI